MDLNRIGTALVSEPLPILYTAALPKHMRIVTVMTLARAPVEPYHAHHG
jgi:hypothetical protein